MLITFVLSLAFADDSAIHQMQKDYLRDCGGKIYSKCDDETRSQDKLFGAAKEVAARTGRRVLVIAGADWCPPCVAFARRFARDAEFRARLERGNVVIELNVEVNSTRKLLGALGVNVPSFPTFLAYDPRTDRVQRLEKVDDDEQWTAILAGEAETPIVAAPSLETEALGVAPFELLNKPIVRRSAHFGSSDIVISTRLTGAARRQLLENARRALDLYQGFDWINASRAALEALAAESSNPVLRTVLALSATQLANTDSVYVKNQMDQAVQDAGAFPLDGDDRKFVHLARDLVCLNRTDGCGERELVMEGEKARIARALPFGKADYQAFALFYAKDWDGLENLARAKPAHSAAHHYLTHGYESQGKPEPALLEAELYLAAAPDLPHAHHMYGHILPQLGRWDEALAEFKKAHALHRQEFESEGVQPHQDWHYAHNSKLLAATLVHLDRGAEGLTTFTRIEDVMTLLDLSAALGSFATVDSISRELMTPREDPAGLGRRVLLLLGQKRVAEAGKLLDQARGRGELDLPALLYARVAYTAVVNGLGSRGRPQGRFERALLAQLADLLGKPGFEAWSSAAMERRILTEVLRVNGRQDVAERIQALPGFRPSAGTCLNP